MGTETVRLGTAKTRGATRVMLLGSGELGKEVAIELQRLGVEVIAVDRYANAPAMQVAHRSHVIDMLDERALRGVIARERPDLVVPEIEAIATDLLVTLEAEGLHVVPTARAAKLTMDREGIRRMAAEELGLLTSPYRFADSEDEARKAADAIGYPVVIKPVMSSSGKGQSVAKNAADMADVWRYSQDGGRTGASRIIVEGFVDFDYEITLLTVRHSDGHGGTRTTVCAPIGHRQVDGDYRESWQPQRMSDTALRAATQMAERACAALVGDRPGWGVFGVEMFIKGDVVIFSEASPRPHDTGLVTLISQDLSEFALHVRAILGLPIPAIRQFGPSASHVILGHGTSNNPAFDGVDAALAESDTQLRVFGKPSLAGTRRLGVALARGETIEAARARAERSATAVIVSLD
ncbi:phosphoribosylglycinamide formyltransferase 2 [Algimonas arctica]|uniref:Formate-dependent phosphoribosylglycinamide formyltransferase n=1 Tax=Algimonas arctica TaxID=1479486 RepID=A0A8J3G372_9PROT|nr:formate-dependent phosphoribosylglycinamide formyltransferase [Algimonas arctica]GHB01923.1 phosphoribosylglycinamide formyltransferase 2 [Algimonas arctica]